MTELNFDEIKDGHQFEELAAEYFRSLKDIPGCLVVSIPFVTSSLVISGVLDLRDNRI